jgi:phosphoribosylformylglycinamidine synthase
VLRIEGTNNEEEVAYAFSAIGTKAEVLHLKELGGSKKLFDYQVLAIPGGFSTGDYVRAGAIFAALLKSKLGKELEAYVQNRYPVIGICNGFQVLVELGLLPGFRMFRVEAALTGNDSNRFECRATLVRHVNAGTCVFTRAIARGQLLQIPSAHAEGKFVFPRDKQKEYLQKLIDNDQVVFRYANPEGDTSAGYPYNPNGSLYNIAAICDPEGTVFGTMPHPERAFHAHMHHYRDARCEAREDVGDGRAIFECVAAYVERRC